MDAQGARSQVNGVLALDLAAANKRTANGQAVRACLDKLGQEISKLASLAQGYPDRSITADILMDGMELAYLGDALTQHLSKAGWIENEAEAAFLWSKAALAIYSHQHHMVGPAMLARGDCAERLGELDNASQIYNAVIADFSWIIEAKASEPHLSQNDREVLTSLATALQRSLALAKNPTPDAERHTLLRQTEDILALREP